jgi:hypothetical protein
MRKNQLVEVVAQLTIALDVAIQHEAVDTMMAGVLEAGFTKDQLKEISKFIKENVTDQQAFASYIDGLKKITRLMDAQKGYEAMGDINLTISGEDRYLESEGASLSYDEVVTKDTRKEA